MRKMRVPIGLIVITIGIIGMFVTWNDYTETRNVAFEYIVENDYVDMIYLKENMASVEILPGTGPNITVSWEEDVNRRGDTLRIEENGNQLEVKRENKGSIIMIPTFNLRKNNVKIYVPDEMLAVLTINNSLGSVLVRDIQVEELSVKTDVQLIEIENVKANNIEATTSVGSIEIENSTGNIIAISNVGSIDMEVKEIVGDIHLRSDVGSVLLTVDEKQENVSFTGVSELGSVRIFGGKAPIYINHAKYEVYMQTDVGSVEVEARK